jgi:fimbrial chaperone protein
MTSTTPRWFWARFAIALWFLVLATGAHASLQVFPTRVILSDKKTISHLSLRHTGNTPGRYNISAVFYRMSPQGNLELVENPTDAERSAIKLIRFSPKKTTIGPNQEQVVRVIYAGPKNLPDGEYRAHIHFEPLDAPEPAVGAAPPKPGAVTMAMTAKIAVAVPLIYRKGNPEFKATLANLGLLRLPDQTPAFRADMTSEGNAFAFGDFYAFFTPAGTTQPKPIGVVRAVASYNAKREIQYPLTIPEGVSISNGTFRLEFRAPEDRGGGLITFLEAPVQ